MLLSWWIRNITLVNHRFWCCYLTIHWALSNIKTSGLNSNSVKYLQKNNQNTLSSLIVLSIEMSSFLLCFDKYKINARKYDGFHLPGSLLLKASGKQRLNRNKRENTTSMFNTVLMLNLCATFFRCICIHLFLCQCLKGFPWHIGKWILQLNFCWNT